MEKLQCVFWENCSYIYGRTEMWRRGIQKSVTVGGMALASDEPNEVNLIQNLGNRLVG